MRYVTITTWELTEGVDFDLTLERMQATRLPALKDLGADRVQIVRTSERTVAAISEWPDKASRDTAAAMIEKVRGQLRSEDHTKMTGEMLGEVVAEV